MKRVVLALTLSMLTLSLAANAGSMGKKDIVDTAVAAGDFKTLAAALKAAGLVDNTQGGWSLHRVRAHRRSFCQVAGRHGRRSAQG